MINLAFKAISIQKYNTWVVEKIVLICFFVAVIYTDNEGRDKGLVSIKIFV